MTAFTFNTTKSVICEPGSIKKLGAIVKEQVGNRVLIVTDPGLIQAGLLSSATDSLDQAGVQYQVFDGVVADPPVAVVEAALADARAANIDGVIGFGGGSSMDIAKLIALLIGGGEKLDDIYGVGMAKGQRLPLIQIPTTAGTGSEVMGRIAAPMVGGMISAVILALLVIPVGYYLWKCRSFSEA